MKKAVALLTVLTLVTGVFSGCGTAKTEGENTTAKDEVIDIRAGVNTASLAYPYQVALEQGIFEKYNLNVTINTQCH